MRTLILASGVFVGCSAQPVVHSADTDSERLERGTLALARDDPKHTLRIIEGPFVLTDLEVSEVDSILYTGPAAGGGCSGGTVPAPPRPDANGKTLMPGPNRIVATPENATRIRVNRAPLHGARYFIRADEVLCIADVLTLQGPTSALDWRGADLTGNWAGFRPW
jgi:hypothetical protein